MHKQRRAVDILLAGSAIAYPVIVFLLRGSMDPGLFILLALVVIGLRLAVGDFRVATWRPALAGAAVLLVVLALLDRALAARAYPVLLSLAVAFVFAVTLLRPPSLVEQFARAGGAPWSPGLQHYCRNVTVLWTVWLCLNAAIAGGLAVSGNDRGWALWTGALSYVASGVLFGGEWLVRGRFRRS